VSDYNESLTAARTLLDDYRITKKPTIEEAITSKLSQLEICVKQMGIEVKSHGPSQKKVLQERIVEYRKTISTTRCEFRRAQFQFGDFVGGMNIEDVHSAQPRIYREMIT
jgi:hypothetical protein